MLSMLSTVYIVQYNIYIYINTVSLYCIYVHFSISYLVYVVISFNLIINHHADRHAGMKCTYVSNKKINVLDTLKC